MYLLFNLQGVSTEMLEGSLFNLILRFGLNLLATIFVIIFVYFRATGKRSYVFTYILISTTIFFLCYLLGRIDLQLGFALGLFAIFGIVRYRTNTIPIKEMTYLFLVITLSVINALASYEVSVGALFFTNFCLMATTWVMEKVWLKRHLACRTLIYDRVDLIHPAKREALKNDVLERIGVQVVKIKIGQIDLSKNSVRLTIFYKDDGVLNMLSETEMNDKNFDN